MPKLSEEINTKTTLHVLKFYGANPDTSRIRSSILDRLGGGLKIYTPVHIIVKDRQTFIHDGSKSTSVSTHFHESSLFFWTLTSYSFTYSVFTCPGHIKLVSHKPCEFNTKSLMGNIATLISSYRHTTMNSSYLSSCTT